MWNKRTVFPGIIMGASWKTVKISAEKAEGLTEAAISIIMIAQFQNLIWKMVIKKYPDFVGIVGNFLYCDEISAALKDLRPEDKRRVGQLMKILAEEKQIKENLQYKI